MPCLFRDVVGAVPCIEKTDCHNQSADWFRNDEENLRRGKFYVIIKSSELLYK